MKRRVFSCHVKRDFDCVKSILVNFLRQLNQRSINYAVFLVQMTVLFPGRRVPDSNALQPTVAGLTVVDHSKVFTLFNCCSVLCLKLRVIRSEVVCSLYVMKAIVLKKVGLQLCKLELELKS